MTTAHKRHYGIRLLIAAAILGMAPFVHSGQTLEHTPAKQDAANAVLVAQYAPVPRDSDTEPDLAADDAPFELPPVDVPNEAVPMGEPVTFGMPKDWKSPDGVRIKITWTFTGFKTLPYGPNRFVPFVPREGKYTGVRHAVWATEDDLGSASDSFTLTFGQKIVKPLAELAGPHKATLALWYIAQIDAAAYIDSPAKFHEAHAGELARLGLADSEYAAEVATRFAGIDEGDWPKPLIDALAKVVKELGAEPGPIDPTPEPGPVVPVAGLRVLIVEETLDRGRLPTGQLAVIGAKAVRDYVESHGGQLRVIDDDSDPHLLSSEWQAIRAAVQMPSPAWAVYTSAGGTAEPLPASVDEAINKLQRVAP